MVMAPLFFAVYFFPQWIGAPAPWTVPILWVLFIASELTDMLDGRIARKRGEVSDFGKLFDPFADTLVRLTYFLCLTVDRVLPAILFLGVIYREYGILFMRVLMMRKGVAMGARRGGKVKAVAYAAAGGMALLSVSLVRLGFTSPALIWIRRGATALFAASVLLAITSFMDYLKVYRSRHQVS
jgi:CDP-diacylglycerol--glycerol-3-phosphate 3-phosphatidyltransferase